MLGDDINQQLEYQAQQTFRADEGGVSKKLNLIVEKIFLKYFKMIFFCRVQQQMVISNRFF